MQKVNSIIKQLITGTKKSDDRSIRRRRMISIVLFLSFWIMSVLTTDTNLFFNWYKAYNTSQNIIELFIHVISWFFTPQALFIIFSIVIGLLSAYKISSKYFAAILGQKNIIHSDITLWKRIFGVPKKTIFKIDAHSKSEKKYRYLSEIGGPARIVIPAEYAVIFEKYNHAVQIVGPTMNLPHNQYLMENFEVLKDVVDLQNNKVRLDVEICTKDGYPLVIRNLRAIFSVYRNSKTTTLTRPYPFNAHGIFSIYYQAPCGSMQDKFIEILKCEMTHFARNFVLSDLTPSVFQESTVKNDGIEEIIKPNSLKIFNKRKTYYSLIRKKPYSFFTNHVHVKKRARMNQKRIHIPFLDITKYPDKVNEKHATHSNGSMVDFFSAFQTYIKPILIENGFQLVLMTRGIFEKK